MALSFDIVIVFVFHQLPMGGKSDKQPSPMCLIPHITPAFV